MPAPAGYTTPAFSVEDTTPAPSMFSSLLSPWTSTAAPAPVVFHLCLWMSTLRFRLHGTLHLHRLLGTSRLRQVGTQHRHLSWRTSLQLPKCRPLPAPMDKSAPVLDTLPWRQTWTQHRTIVENIAPALAACYAPAPVDEYMAPASTIAARQRYTFCHATGRCEHGLSPEFHREVETVAWKGVIMLNCAMAS